jgi:TonB family protein
MRLASFVMSFCLHSGFMLLLVFWPAPPLHKAEPQPMMVSLVDDLPGGNQTPAPVPGPLSAPTQRQEAPAPTQPKDAPPPEAIPIPAQEAPPSKLEPPKPVAKPVVAPDAALLAEKKEEPKQPDPPKPDPPKPDPPKPEPPKLEPPKRNPAEEALAKIKAAAKAPQKPNVIADALKFARKESGGGGGGGESAGGGSVGDVYGAQIVMAVQPNWHWPALAQGNLSVILYLKIDAVGRVLDVRVVTSSGNALFDSSAVAAVRRTQALPPPPSPAYNEIELPLFPMR